MSSLVESRRVEALRNIVVSDAAQRAAPWLLTLLALVTRFFRVSANGLRTDEMYSVWMAARPLGDMLRAIVLEGHDATPPTYYTLLHLALQVSWDLWAIRFVSVLAGAVVVWLTFRLALHLIDFHVAVLSALFVALAPFSIEYSQVARAYMLTAVFALASIYLFIRLYPPVVRPHVVWLFAAVTMAALATHYLAGILLVLQNAVVVTLAMFQKLPRRKIVDWFKLQVLMGLVALPLVWMALQRVPGSNVGTGQSWLPAPSPSIAVKSLILWGTGDPSYGGASFTLMRLASLLVITATLVLGAATAWRLWQTEPARRVEVARVAYLAATFFGVWGIALAVSLVRKVFHEKYFIYLSPLLIILIVWTLMRLRPLALAQGLLLALGGLTALALFVFYTSPSGEQWREAMRYVNQERRPGDYIVTAPGYYFRPALYYLDGRMAPDDYELGHAPITVIAPDGISGATASEIELDLPNIATAVAPAERIWIVRGYAPADPSQVEWFYSHYLIVRERHFLGVEVILAERDPGRGSAAAPASRTAVPLMQSVAGSP